MPDVPDVNEDGLVVPGVWDSCFTWHYDPEPPGLEKLYEKAKRSQWNAASDIDWSIEVDPRAPGGLADYLPLMASDSFGTS